MKNKKVDLRIRRTKKLLSNALFSLIKDKPLDEISVCMICERAMVHRTTFYARFKDKYALLDYCLDEHIPFEKLNRALSDSENDISTIVGDVIKYICKNKEIYASILKNNNAFFMVKRFKTILKERICESIKTLNPNWEDRSIQPELYASYFAGACINILSEWIVNEIELPPETLTENLNTLLSLSFKLIL